jgi:hypothetical protein|tara:strand:- start:144 stop:434 length:291 start_codon:yes stop_codon:yes gene_type:complete
MSNNTDSILIVGILISLVLFLFPRYEYLKHENENLVIRVDTWSSESCVIVFERYFPVDQLSTSGEQTVRFNNLKNKFYLCPENKLKQNNQNALYVY